MSKNNKVRRFLSEPEEVKRSRLKDFGRMLLDRIKERKRTDRELL